MLRSFTCICFYPNLRPYTNMNTQWIWDTAKHKSFKNNIEELYGFSVGKDFSNKTQKAQMLKEKMIKFLALKYKTLFTKDAKHKMES